MAFDFYKNIEQENIYKDIDTLRKDLVGNSLYRINFATEYGGRYWDKNIFVKDISCKYHGRLLGISSWFSTINLFISTGGFHRMHFAIVESHPTIAEHGLIYHNILEKNVKKEPVISMIENVELVYFKEESQLTNKFKDKFKIVIELSDFTLEVEYPIEVKPIILQSECFYSD